MLTADQLKAKDRESRSRVHPVEVPQWGMTVYVRRMSATDRDAFATEFKLAEQGGRPLRGWLAALCLCDEKGTPLFHVSQADEVGQMDGQAIELVTQAAMEFNGLTDKAIGQAEKNSEATPSV